MPEPINLTPTEAAGGTGGGPRERSYTERGRLTDTSQHKSRHEAGRELGAKLRARREAAERAAAPAPEPQEAPQPAPEPRSTEPSIRHEEPPAPAEPSPEPEPIEDQAAAPDEPSEGAAEGEDDTGIEVETLEDLLEAIGWDMDQFRGLKRKVKLDGEEIDDLMSDALDNRQFAKRNTEQSQKLATRRKEFVREVEQQREALSQQVNVVKQQMQAMHHVLGAQLETNPEIAGLREANPASYIWFQKHYEGLQKQVADAYNNLTAREAHEAQQLQQNRLREEIAMLQEEIPDWGPEKEKVVLSTAEEFGLDPERERHLLDRRSISLLLAYHEQGQRLAEYEARDKKAKASVKKIYKNAARSGKPKAANPSARSQSKREFSAALDEAKGLHGHQRRKAVAKALATSRKAARKGR